MRKAREHSLALVVILFVGASCQAGPDGTSQPGDRAASAGGDGPDGAGQSPVVGGQAPQGSAGASHEGTGGAETAEAPEITNWLGTDLPIPKPRALSSPPAAGVHPRILMSPEDLPEHRTRSGEGGVAHQALEALKADAALTLDAPNTELGALYARLRSGDASVSLSDDQLGLGTVTNYGSGLNGLYGKLAGAGWVALMVELDALGTERATALATAAEVHAARYIPELENKLAHDASVDLALAYDFLHGWMTEEQRATVRGLLAAMTSGRSVYGVGMSPSENSTNWRTHHDHLAVAALAIEGEEGYDATVFEDNVEKLRVFLSQYGVAESGVPHEGLAYYAFGMHWGALSTLAAARRGHDLFEQTHLYRSLHYALRETAPWGAGQVFGHGDGAGWATGSGASSMYTVLKYMWPDDILSDYIYRENRQGGRQEKIPLIEAIFGLKPLSADAQPSDVAEAKDLPLTLYLPLKGYVYARSSWDAEAVRLDFDCRSDLWDLGHIHADRNGFTLSALGRRWVFDPGYHMEASDMHATVLIDGLGPSGTSSDSPHVWPPMPGRMVSVEDHGTFVTATGDARAAYSWARPRGEELSDVGLSWGDFLASDAPRGEVHEGSVPARSYNPVLSAFRTVMLARGAHPFVVVVDDIEKDGTAHDYEWMFNTRGAYPWNELTMVLESGSATEAILRHEEDTEPGSPRLWIRAIQAEGEEEPMELRDDELPNNAGNLATHRRFILARRNTVAPEFKVLLLPHRSGESLPTVEWTSSDELQLSWSDETATVVFAHGAEGTEVSLTVTP